MERRALRLSISVALACALGPAIGSAAAQGVGPQDMHYNDGSPSYRSPYHYYYVPGNPMPGRTGDCYIDSLNGRLCSPGS